MSAGPHDPCRYRRTCGGLEQRRRDLPQAFDPVRPREEGVVAEQGIVEQSLVARELLVDTERNPLSGSQRGRAEIHRRARLIGEEVQPDHARVGEFEGQSIGVGRRGARGLRNGREHPASRLLEAQRDGVATLGQRLARAQLKRNAAQRELSIRTLRAANVSTSEPGATRASERWPSYCPKITRPGSIESIASNTRPAASHSETASSRLGGVHGDEAEQVQEMSHDHVAERAGLLEESGAALDRQTLGHIDLDVVDVVAVPDRLEQAVGEAKREDVLHALFAQEVVDAKDLVLVERGVQDPVERACRRQVTTERLFDDQLRRAASPVAAIISIIGAKAGGGTAR